MTYTPVGGRRSARTAVIAGVGVLALAAALFGGYLWGHASHGGAAGAAAGAGPVVEQSAAVPPVAAGPARIVGGIPAGFAHDRDGALAAGLGFLQASALVDAQQVTPHALTAAMVAANPSPAVGTFLDPGGLNSAPAEPGLISEWTATLSAYKVESYSTAAAQVSYWWCLTGGTSTNTLTGPLVNSGCYLSSLALAWENDDWKIADYSGKGTASLNLTELVQTQGYNVPGGAFTVFTQVQR